MRRHLLIPLLFMLALGSLAPELVAADATTYQDPGGAFSFTLPDGWKVDTSPDGVMFGDGVTPTAVLLKTRPANGSSLDDAFQQDLGPLTKDANLQGNPVSELTVGGQPAKRTSFRTLDGFPILPGVITVINNGTVYSIGYLTESESAAEAPLSTILSSWQFT